MATKFPTVTLKSGRKVTPTVDPTLGQADIVRAHPDVAWAFYRPNDVTNPRKGGFEVATADGKVIAVGKHLPKGESRWYTDHLAGKAGRDDTWAGLLESGVTAYKRSKSTPRTPKGKAAPKSETVADTVESA